VDLSVFTGAISNLIEQMASQSGVPGHILLRLEAQFPSGGSIMAAESSLVDKAKIQGEYERRMGGSRATRPRAAR
jgi:hypothetical protein